jgi:hypothetical protein
VATLDVTKLFTQRVSGCFDLIDQDFYIAVEFAGVEFNLCIEQFMVYPTQGSIVRVEHKVDEKGKVWFCAQEAWHPHDPDESSDGLCKYTVKV